MKLEPLALCPTYRTLMDALKARRLALGYTQLEVDERAGLQDGYCGKLEAWDRDSGRRLGPVSFDLVLEAYGLAAVLVETRPRAPSLAPDPDQLALPLTGGGMCRHSDREAVRLPGRNRRRAAAMAAALQAEAPADDPSEPHSSLAEAAE